MLLFTTLFILFCSFHNPLCTAVIGGECNEEQADLVVSYILPHKTRTYTLDEYMIIKKRPSVLARPVTEQVLHKRLKNILQDTYHQEHSRSWQIAIVQELMSLELRLPGITTSLGTPFSISFLALLEALKKPVLVMANGYQYSFIRNENILILTIFKQPT